MKALQDRIIAYVTASNGLVSLEKLLTVTAAKGFSEGEVLAALSGIGNKLKATARGDTIYYQVPPIKKLPIDHLKWARDNYPRMTEETDGSGIDIDYSFLFLKTKEERDAYLAEAKGMSVHMLNNKKYAKKI